MTRAEIEARAKHPEIFKRVDAAESTTSDPCSMTSNAAPTGGARRRKRETEAQKVILNAAEMAAFSIGHGSFVLSVKESPKGSQRRAYH
jgi:hypothetical protein